MTGGGEGPFRFPVQWVNRPNLDFRGFSGTIAAGTQIASKARIPKRVDRIGKITSDRSFFKTSQLCPASAQPRSILPIAAPLIRLT